MAVPDPAIYFVSDTHLGDGTGADRFRYPEQFLALLQRIEKEPSAHLVLLGDFMELWASSMEAVLMHYAPLFQAILKLAEVHPVTYVVGNHDCVPWYAYIGSGIGRMLITERLTLGRGALVALHGHQFDPFNQVKVDVKGDIKVPWTRRLVQTIGFLGRVGGNDVADAIARILNQESPGERGYPKEERWYDEAARAMLRGRTKFVVMGHTHHPLIHRYGPRVYVNTGSWVSPEYPPTYARFAAGGLELLHGETHQPYEPSGQMDKARLI